MAVLATGFGSISSGTEVTAVDYDGYEFVSWICAVTAYTVAICYLEWPTSKSTKVWIPSGGSHTVYGFALYRKV